MRKVWTQTLEILYVTLQNDIIYIDFLRRLLDFVFLVSSWLIPLTKSFLIASNKLIKHYETIKNILGTFRIKGALYYYFYLYLNNLCKLLSK